jgi:hypothetical protein
MDLRATRYLYDIIFVFGVDQEGIAQQMDIKRAGISTATNSMVK